MAATIAITPSDQFNTELTAKLMELDGDTDQQARLLSELKMVLRTYPKCSVAATAQPATKTTPRPHTMSWNVLAPLSLDEIVLGATDGNATLAQTKNVFTGHLDPDFKNWRTDRSSDPTVPLHVAVYEMRMNASFASMFNSLGGVDLDALCLTQGQIIDFCVNHCDSILKDADYTFFFLFRIDLDYLVVSVKLDKYGLSAIVFRFDDPNVWYASNRLRVIIPRL
jgi:hypothetical protein